MRALVVFVAVVGCANVADEPATDAGVVEDSARTPDVDTAACASRTEACGALSSDPLMRILRACVEKEWSCGFATFTIDAEGCASTVSFDRERPGFEACVRAELSTKRFACIMPGTTFRNFESCTTK